MAKILPFAKSRVARRSHQPKAEGEIVIFPGVRVEYHDGAAQPKAKRRRRKPDDDVLSA